MTQPAPIVADPYRTLGVSRVATDLEIKAAHRKLAKRYHPDAGDGDTRRFLRVQEAYRVLSDPLLRREWDARHAPGPVRANRGERPQRAPRSRPAPTTPKAAPASEPGESPPPPRDPRRDPRREPRSSRAYTWSAGEVPWWEEGVRHENRRPSRTSSAAQPDADRGAQAASPTDAPNEFDVYNRSSGAAWSMAARAYFRRGDQDLPRRGSFHHQGTQPLTAARARTAAEQERRRAAAAAGTASASTARAAPAPPAAAPKAAPSRRSTAAQQPAQPKASPQSASAQRTAPRSAAPPRYESTARQSRERIVQRALPQTWPSVGQRLVHAAIAWLPFAAAIISASSVRIDEVMQGMLMALTLGLLVAVPRLAYVLAVATLGMLVVGFLFIAALAWLGTQLPLSTGMVAAVGAALALGYVATAGMVALGPPALRPWTRSAQPVSNR